MVAQELLKLDNRRRAHLPFLLPQTTRSDLRKKLWDRVYNRFFRPFFNSVLLSVLFRWNPCTCVLQLALDIMSHLRKTKKITKKRKKIVENAKLQATSSCHRYNRVHHFFLRLYLSVCVYMCMTNHIPIIHNLFVHCSLCNVKMSVLSLVNNVVLLIKRT